MGSGTYNGNANVTVLADAVAMDPKLKGELFSRFLDVASQSHNAFAKFTTEADHKTGINGGVQSIFGSKQDLKAGGADLVNFSVMGPPGGPGVMGSQELTGNTSQVLMDTFSAKVGWHRDAVEYSRDVFEFLSAGKSLDSASYNALAKKMGLLRQNHMMMRLILSADGNVFRPNNRATTDAILSTDTLQLAMASAAKARLNTMGGRPIMQSIAGKTGSPLHGYLNFFSDHAFLSLHNNDGYASALQNGDTRGDENANFTGQLLAWKGQNWYEQPSHDEKWDDFIGSPIQPKAKLGVAFSTASAAADTLIKSSATNTKSRYTQFFPGYQYPFQETEVAASDANTYYAWIINPDGSVGFVSYVGTNNNGNQILLTSILSPNGAGTSTKGATTVGELKVNTTAAPDEWTGGDGNLPVGWTYTDSFQVGAIVIWANSKGNQIGRGFIFGAMAAFFANGRIGMVGIEQERDYGFVKGRGYETIFGTTVARDPFGKPYGYLLAEVAMTHEGYETPVPATF